MLPVRQGDCFFLEFVSGDKPFNIMIDCGPAEAWDTVKCFLDNLILQKKQIDILLLTHFDSDHIGGALAMLREKQYRDLIKSVWHNSLEQIAPAVWEDNSDVSEKAFRDINQAYDRYRLPLPLEDGPVSAEESITLSLAIKKYGMNVNTNSVTNETKQDPLGAGKDIIVDFLLPTKDRLDDLLEIFTSKLKAMNAKPAKTAIAMEAFEKLVLQPVTELTDGEIAASRPKAVDSSPTNAASIAVIIRFNGLKLFFPGDAVDRDLLPALTSWLEVNPKENLIFDIVKLPHHGSARNCWRLLKNENFAGRIYLVSTNGFHYNHPDPETITQLKTKKFNEPYAIYFNDSDIMKAFSVPEPKDNPLCTIAVQRVIPQKITHEEDK